MSHSVSHMTRGGQVWAHQIRMSLQVCKNAGLIALTLTLMVMGFFLMENLTFESLYLWGVSWWAGTKLTFSNLLSHGQAEISFWSGRGWNTWDALHFIHHPYTQDSILLAKSSFSRLWSPATIGVSLWVFTLSFFGVGAYFTWSGWSVRQKEHVRGLKLVSVKQLKRMMGFKKLKSDLHLDGVPLVKDRETSHMLIAGTTSSGKTNALNHLLPQIRDKKAVIVDLTGELTKRYFDPKRDVLLSPSHPESSQWNPWLDTRNIFEYRGLAEAFVGEGSKHDPFWSQAATECLAAALEKLCESQSISELTQILTKDSLESFCKFFEGTSAASYADPKGERTTVSIRSTLVSKIQSLEIMAGEKKGEFSFREWMKQDEKPGWLFLTTRPDQREVLCPLISAHLGMSLKALMQLDPDPKRRCWIIIDELPALNKTPALLTTATEGRKYGACLVAGIQDMAQLKAKYGIYEAQTLLNQMNTKVFFRFKDPESSSMISKMLGAHEEKTMKENISYGANTIRDGVSMNEATTKEALVMPTEIESLKNLECFIRLPEDFPIVKHQMSFKKVEEKG